MVHTLVREWGSEHLGMGSFDDGQTQRQGRAWFNALDEQHKSASRSGCSSLLQVPINLSTKQSDLLATSTCAGSGGGIDDRSCGQLKRPVTIRLKVNPPPTHGCHASRSTS